MHYTLQPTILAAVLFFSYGHAAPSPVESTSPVPSAQGTTGNFTGPSPQNVGTFQAFYRNQCDGGAGSVISLSSGGATCIKTQDRHSYKIDGNCNAIITHWSQEGCSGIGVGGDGGDGCHNVNTGYNWGSTTFGCA
jgi:hypothetical protein